MYNAEKRLKELKAEIDLIEQHHGKRMLTTPEAALYLGIAKSTLYKHTSAGNIAYYKPNGKLIMFSRTDLNKWLEANRIPSNEELQNM